MSSGERRSSGDESMIALVFDFDRFTLEWAKLRFACGPVFGWLMVWLLRCDRTQIEFRYDLSVFPPSCTGTLAGIGSHLDVAENGRKDSEDR